jgi:hypothetical protein
MAVIVSNGSTTLATASGFYRSEANNIGMFSTTMLALSTGRTIAFTPANAGNALGVAIGLSNSSYTISTMKDVTVTLEELVGGTTWTPRTSKTLTGAEITNSAGITYGNPACYYIKDFIFDTPGSYAVTTTAGIWRLNITESVTGTGIWQLMTSDATNPFYILWCDTAVSYTDNTDQILAKGTDKVTIDMNATFKGKLGTGDTTRSVCAIAGTSTTPDTADVCNFVWENPAVASYTLNIDGRFVLASAGGFRAGTSANPILSEHAGTINFISATSGTAANTGFCDPADSGNVSRNGPKTSLILYGEIPATRNTTLKYHAAYGITATMTIASPCVVTAEALYTGTPVAFTTTIALPTGVTSGTVYWARLISGTTFHLYDTYAHAIDTGSTTGRVDTSGSQSGVHTLNSVIYTNDNTAWASPDLISIGRCNIKGAGDAGSTYTVSSVTTDRIILTVNLAANVRYAGAPVIRHTGYGLTLSGVSLTTVILTGFVGPSNFIISGVRLRFLSFVLGTPGSGASFDDTGHASKMLIEDCSYEGGTAPSSLFSAAQPSVLGMKINRVHSNRGGFGAQQPNTLFPSCSSFLFTNNIFLCLNGSSPSTISINGAVVTDNIFNNGGNGMIQLAGANYTVEDNDMWGQAATTGGCFNLNAFFFPLSWKNNIYNCNATAIYYNGPCVGLVAKNDTFGNLLTSTTDLKFAANQFSSSEWNSPTGTLTITDSEIAAMTPGSQLRISDYNDTPNDDRDWLPLGRYQRTGDGLTGDTTVRTAGTGKFAIRLQPVHATSLLAFPNLPSERAVPTGNIQNKTMTVSVWCYINNTAYDAGTYTYPTLNVKYDNATTVTSVATATFGSWQQLACIITPTTTYGQIEVWITGATDAAGANAYFYLDDFNIAYPAGVQVDLGGMDLWANATPIWPPIATVPSLGGVWDEATSAHTVAGSFGSKLKGALTLPKFMGLK